MAHPVHDANENRPYGDLKKDEFYKKYDVSHQESFMVNGSNMKIYTHTWQPADLNCMLKGVVAMIHGYTAESGWIFELNAVALAKAGFLVCALDLQGHGFSEGSPDHIPDVEPLVCDCLQYFDSIRGRNPTLPPFLYGESLGGALAILICLKQKTEWKGLILSGPMCEVSRKYKPMWPLEKLLPAAAFVAPSWRIAITGPPLSRSLKENWKRKLAERSPNRRTCGKPTAASALEFLKVCEKVKTKYHELQVPMLILHGGDDMICDPQGAKHLHETAASKDKTLKIFSGMWHQLIGEPNDSAERVLKIIQTWLEARTDPCTKI